MKNVERINALNKMLLNANVVAYGAMVDFFNISLYSISKNTWILDVHGIGGNC